MMWWGVVQMEAKYFSAPPAALSCSLCRHNGSLPPIGTNSLRTCTRSSRCFHGWSWVTAGAAIRQGAVTCRSSICCCFVSPPTHQNVRARSERLVSTRSFWRPDRSRCIEWPANSMCSWCKCCVQLWHGGAARWGDVASFFFPCSVLLQHCVRY